MISGRKITLTATAGFILLATLSGCKKEVTQQVSLLPVVEEILFDTSSVYHIDFAAYPTNLRNLPVGVLGKDTTSLETLERLMNVDLFDNITGEVLRDSIRDFAGEHFIFRIDTDTTSYAELLEAGRKEEIVERIVRSAALLLKDSVKIIVFASDSASLYGYDAVRSLLENGGSPVQIIKLDNLFEETAANAYTALRSSNLLAFRITPQNVRTNLNELKPVVPQNDSTTISEEIENVPAQDSTGRD